MKTIFLLLKLILIIKLVMTVKFSTKMLLQSKMESTSKLLNDYHNFSEKMNRLENGNYFGLSEDTLEHESKSLDLRFNDLLNVFVHPEKYDPKPYNSKYTTAPTNPTVMNRNNAYNSANVSKEELEVWDSNDI